MSKTGLTERIIREFVKINPGHTLSTDTCAARVFRGTSDSMDNQKIWGIDLRGGVYLLTEGTNYRNLLKQFLEKLGLSEQTDRSFGEPFSYFHITDGSAIEARLDERNPHITDGSAIEARLDERNPPNSVLNFLKRTYAFFDRTYRFTLDHPDEVKNVRDNYSPVMHETGWISRVNRKVNYLSPIEFTNRDIAKILLYSEEIREKAKNSEPCICLGFTVSVSPLPIAADYSTTQRYALIRKDVEKEKSRDELKRMVDRTPYPSENIAKLFFD